jgi:CRP/FNR family transcriptional regulator, cyclic AMP receptor protein
VNGETKFATGLTEDERAALNRWRWFSGLSPLTRHDLLRHAKVNRYPCGQVISHRGDLSSDWMACAAGVVRIGASDARGKASLLSYIQAGVWFAGPGLFDDGPSTHEAVAVGETTVLSIGRRDFLALLSGNAELSVAVLRLQARHVRELYEAMEATNTLPLRPRLAKQLDMLARRHGVPAGTEERETLIGLRIGQDGLAQLVGSSRQRVNVQLKEMERAGVIRVLNRGVVICDSHALRAEWRV